MNKGKIKVIEKNKFFTDTCIEVRDAEGNLLCPKFSNTFVKVGILDFIECLAETKHINYMILSEEQNREADTTELNGASLGITSNYSYRDESTGAVVMVFELVASKDDYSEIANLNSLGLMIDDKLVTVANAGGLPIGDTDNISITYSVLISLL